MNIIFDILLLFVSVICVKDEDIAYFINRIDKDILFILFYALLIDALTGSIIEAYKIKIKYIMLWFVNLIMKMRII